jgi:hypothetical protein
MEGVAMKRSRIFTTISFATAAAAAAFATGAYARPINDLLTRNAAQQAHIRNDLAASKMDPLRAAQVEQKAAEVYRLQSQMLADSSGDRTEQLRQAQRDLAGAINWAEKHPAKYQGSAMDRTHLQVASMRNAEQQRLIARGFASGQLSAEQAASLEGVQAQIARAEADAASNGHETVEAARSIQGAQDVEDYSIKKDPGVDERLANLTAAR